MESIDLSKIVPNKKPLRALTMVMLLSFYSVIVSGFNLEIRTVMASQQTQKTKEFTLIAEETTLNISPSKKINAWTYNGTIPGPTIRVTEGDKVVLHFINNLKLSHTVHFHGGHNGTVDGFFEIVPPNHTFTYRVYSYSSCCFNVSLSRYAGGRTRKNGTIRGIYCGSQSAFTSSKGIFTGIWRL